MLIDRDSQRKKAAGILTEADGENVYIGIGVNVAQKAFSPELQNKACSIAQILAADSFFDDNARAKLADKRFTLLEKILFHLHNEMENTSCAETWRKRLEEKLYMKGRKVCFIPGLPEELAGKAVPPTEGILHGIGRNGEIVIEKDSGKLVSFVSGELNPDLPQCQIHNNIY